MREIKNWKNMFAVSLFAVTFVAGGCSSKDGGADGTVDGGADGSVDSGTDVGVDASVDVGADVGADVGTGVETDVGAEAGEDVGADVGVTCFPGYDSANPEMKLGALVPIQPSVLTMMTTELQTAIDQEETIYLLSVSDITGDGDFDAKFGIGMAGATSGHYSFDQGTADPAKLVLSLTGNDFTSDPSGVDVTLYLNGVAGIGTLDVPVREALISGTFSTDERCAIGEQLTTTIPTSWDTGGLITGMVTMDDASTRTVTLGSLDVTLCGLFAYGLDLVLLMADPNCSADPDTFLNPPDSTTANGEDGWSVEAEYAATAVVID